jgi:hypothetical protein
MKVVSCLEQSFGLDVSDGLVCMWLHILDVLLTLPKVDVVVRSC